MGTGRFGASLQFPLNLVRDFEKSAPKRFRELAEDDATSARTTEIRRLLKVGYAPLPSADTPIDVSPKGETPTTRITFASSVSACRHLSLPDLQCSTIASTHLLKTVNIDASFTGMPFCLNVLPRDVKVWTPLIRMALATPTSNTLSVISMPRAFYTPSPS